ncbi:hypothetical protein NSA47_11525 [Irregularibacter muris]|uniref:Lipoprotein n=1 Tax=Irregularibacter muris TaxID=1796619 RepID=A0AAE3HG92_9FIRM|nr:hypothetical protein [Irregularibacter muris]MCR1899606.1 hypothetical protein [Irregularibacter muris]
MKKRIKFISFFLILVILFTGCTRGTEDFVQRVIPPKNRNIPIEGTWEVTAVLKTDNTNSSTYKDWIGKRIYFNRENALLGEYFLPHPTYQFKKVEGSAYLLYNHQAFPEEYQFDEREIQVINVTDNKNALWEVIKIKEDEIIIKIFNSSYRAKRRSKEVNPEVFQSYQKHDQKEDVKKKSNTESIRAGVLLGLRSPTTQEENYQYRTLWIGMENEKIFPIKDMNHIVFPRKNGFYEMKVEKNHGEDSLVLKSILTELKSNPQQESMDALSIDHKEEIYRKINYIGNDYLSIEETKVTLAEDRKNKQEKSYLKMLAVDSLPNIKAIKISDLLGEAGLKAMEEEVNKRKKSLEIDEGTTSKIEENFGLERKMGYWFLKGRMTPVGNNTVEWDYPINLIPSKPIIFYNELSVPWTGVKDRVPSAIDIFTAPSKDIALIVTKEEIYIYQIEQGILKSPLERIPLKEGESVIMAEWATGPYVKSWNATLSKYISEEEKN